MQRLWTSTRSSFQNQSETEKAQRQIFPLAFMQWETLKMLTCFPIVTLYLCSGESPPIRKVSGPLWFNKYRRARIAFCTIFFILADTSLSRTLSADARPDTMDLGDGLRRLWLKTGLSTWENSVTVKIFAKVERYLIVNIEVLGWWLTEDNVTIMDRIIIVLWLWGSSNINDCIAILSVRCIHL